MTRSTTTIRSNRSAKMDFELKRVPRIRIPRPVQVKLPEFPDPFEHLTQRLAEERHPPQLAQPRTAARARSRQFWDTERIVGVALLSVILALGMAALGALVTAKSATPGTAAARSRSTVPVSVPPRPAVAGSHAFLNTKPDGSPVGWNPCKPIPYWIGRIDLPPGGADLVRSVLAEVTSTSGQQFSFKGFADAVPGGTGWSDWNQGAWIGWSDPSNSVLWKGHDVNGPDPAVGLGSNDAYRSHEADWGFAMLRADYVYPGDYEIEVLRHEVGHMLGLDHTKSPAEVMDPGGPTVDYGPGDRLGLWELGPSRGC